MKALTVALLMITAISNGANVATIKDAGFYSTSMAIVKLDYDTDTVTCMDFNGNLWEYTGIEDASIGDLEAVTMCDNATPNTIYDDIILDTRCSGWVYEWGYDTTTKQPLITFEK